MIGSVPISDTEVSFIREACWKSCVVEVGMILEDIFESRGSIHEGFMCSMTRYVGHRCTCAWSSAGESM